MKISFEKKEELLNQWSSIGENDCPSPPIELTELLNEILDSISEPEKIECDCFYWCKEKRDIVEPDPKCEDCNGEGWYYKKEKGE